MNTNGNNSGDNTNNENTAAGQDANTVQQSETAATNTEATPQQTTTETPVAAAEPAVQKVDITVSGKITAKVQGDVGQTLRMALKTNGVPDYETASFTDAAGKAVSLDRRLSESLVLSSVAKASGG